MEIEMVDETPRHIVRFDKDTADKTDSMSPEQVEHVAEIFNTPLTGTYNWITRLQIIESKNSMN